MNNKCIEIDRDPVYIECSNNRSVGAVHCVYIFTHPKYCTRPFPLDQLIPQIFFPFPSIYQFPPLFYRYYPVFTSTPSIYQFQPIILPAQPEPDRLIHLIFFSLPSYLPFHLSISALLAVILKIF